MQRLAVAFAFADFFAFLDFFEADPWARGIFILVHFSFVQSHNANDGRQRQINCMKKKKKRRKRSYAAHVAEEAKFSKAFRTGL